MKVRMKSGKGLDTLKPVNMIAATHTMGKAIPVVYSLQFFYRGCFFLCLSSLFPAVLATCSATFNAENFIPTPPQVTLHKHHAFLYIS